MLLSQLIQESETTTVLTGIYNPDITGLTSDSREVEAGYLFAALPGSRLDGRDFIMDALKRGAAAVLAPQGTTLPDTTGDVAFIIDAEPRRRFAKLAAAYYPHQPAYIAAVTGTNGKTSVAAFTHQIWRQLKIKAAALGTLGIALDKDVTLKTKTPALTTPDPVRLHKLLNELAATGTDHLAMEASSHGLDQYRLDGVRVTAAAFTNLSRDHLDYHGGMDAYLAAKARLFSDLLIPDGTAVLNADAPEFDTLKEAARGHTIVTYGKNTSDINILDVSPKTDGQDLRVQAFGSEFQVRLPLVGEFQIMNALCALGLVVAEDKARLSDAIAALENLESVRGRMDLVGKTAKGAAVYIDYAHTPDALRHALAALRAHTKNKLSVVFGCGGDRDRGKRPEMGAIACDLADRVVVTDDNPRSEDPAAIRRDIMTGCERAEEIGARTEAIAKALQEGREGDVILIAGKGHETGQIIGGETLPYSDFDAVQAALAEPSKENGT